MMIAAMEGRWDHGGPWEEGKITGLLMVMGATGSRLVSGGMKPPASTFPAVPLPSTPTQHACQDMRARGVHRVVGRCSYPSCRREIDLSGSVDAFMRIYRMMHPQTLQVSHLAFRTAQT